MERVPGVTLLGDAAHLMSPFAGGHLAKLTPARMLYVVAQGRNRY